MKNEQNYKNSDFPFPYLKLGFAFSKEDFLVRVKARTDFMIQAGLIEETSSFLNQNFDGWAPLSSVGYKETTQFLRENKTKDWLRENIIVSTMQLIKKQKTWFKRDASVLWSDHSALILRFLRED